MVRKAALIALAALLIGGCGDDRDGNICDADFPSRIGYAPPMNGEQVQDNARRCVQHWAARLSFSNESAITVAKAAVAACREGLDDVRMYALAEREPLDFSAYETRLMDLALFRAVQQRAGDCGIPELGEMPPPEKGQAEPKTKK